MFGSLDQWWTDLRDQADVAANDRKPGQESGGFGYYLDSLTWGLGWAALAAALVGAVVELRRDLVRGLILIALPLALFAYLATQSRYFGRWLLPAYPALALLGAVGLTQLATLLTRLVADSRRRPLRPAAAGAVLAVLTALVLIQPLAADVRSAQVLGREDTLSQARAWLDERYPPELRVAVEPAVPGRWFRSTPEGRTRPGCRAARAATTGRSPAGPTPARAGGGSARSTSRASSLGPTAACARPRTTRCSGPM